MDLVSAYSPFFYEAHVDCHGHRREMCQIVISDQTPVEILNRLRDSILRFRAKPLKKAPDYNGVALSQEDVMRLIAFMKVQNEFFEKHDRLVDEIAANLKDKSISVNERLEKIRDLLL